MKAPRLEIYLDEKSDLCISKIESIDSEPRLIFNIELDELKSFELEAASTKLGGTILNLLNLWHKDALDGWGIPSAKENARMDDYDIAQSLIGKSMLNKTAIHVQSIELLLSQEANRNENVKQFFENVWPIIRERLKSYGSEQQGS